MRNKLITCWRMQMDNGNVLCFTDCDQDVVFKGERYLAGGYFTPNAIYSSNELAKDDFTISGIIDGQLITKEQLISGAFANAYMEVFLINSHLGGDAENKTILKTGWVGEVKINENNFILAINSLSSMSNNLIGKCYSASCRAEFANKFCKLNEEKYSFKGEVTSLSEENSFIDLSRNEPENYFTYGVIEFYDAVNKGKKYRVSNFLEGKITIDSVVKVRISVGDKYSITAGCDKSLYTCINKFSNSINFRGEPFIPSKHKLLACN